MKKSTKIILMIAGVIALVYVIKKAKNSQEPTINSQQPTTDKGAPVLIDIPQAGSPGLRTGIVGGYTDITLRRCIDANTGKIIYVKGPCPQRNINTVVAVSRG